MRNDFRVAVGVQAMAARRQFCALFWVVEQLAIEDHEYILVLITNRLLAIREADHAEPPGGQCQSGPVQEACFIRAAMDQGLRHPLHHSLGHRPSSC